MLGANFEGLHPIGKNLGVGVEPLLSAIAFSKMVGT